MAKFVFVSILFAAFSPLAQAGYVPPQDDPYWCYEACIDSHSTNHVDCVKKCYESQEACSGNKAILSEFDQVFEQNVDE